MNSRETTAARLCKMASDDFHYGEKAQMEALNSLANFLDLPFVVDTLHRMAGDDFHYGEKASLKAIQILGKMR